jgi:hypothetical protein
MNFSAFHNMNLSGYLEILYFVIIFIITGDLPMKNFIRFFVAFLLALTLLAAGGCASTPKEEGTGEYVDDSVVTSKVKAAILEEPSLSSAEINVETFKGIVQLSGFVKSRADISKAVEVTRKVSGVVSIRNDMRLK